MSAPPSPRSERKCTEFLKNSEAMPFFSQDISGEELPLPNLSAALKNLIEQNYRESLLDESLRCLPQRFGRFTVVQLDENENPIIWPESDEELNCEASRSPTPTNKSVTFREIVKDAEAVNFVEHNQTCGKADDKHGIQRQRPAVTKQAIQEENEDCEQSEIKK